MKVVTAQQMASIDQETIKGGIPGDQLMERAGGEIVRRLLDLFPDLAPPGFIAICCGKGNNGGDGLVMARLLDGLGFQVSVFLLALPEDLAPATRRNQERLPTTVKQILVPRVDWAHRWLSLAAEADLAVDAVFGTGIQLPLRQPYVDLCAAFGSLRAKVLSVDIPSGVCGDTGRVDPVAVKADVTITVGLPKRGLLLPPGRDQVGELEVVDIGFSAEVVDRWAPDHHYLPPVHYACLLPDRPSDVHKYRCGTLLVLAGSRAYGGAAVLAGMGALRSGAGLVTVALPASLETAARVGMPEALIVPLSETPAGTIAPLKDDSLGLLLERKHAVAFGPGLGDDPATDRFATRWLSRLTLPVVVDADGFSAFGRQGSEPSFGSDQVVLTPHAGELARVLGQKPAEVQRNRLELVPELATRWQATLLLKGSPTVIADPAGSLYFNPTGDDSLAHGGTGDVLTGLIAGLLAQGCPAPEAALLGAYLHGQAGQIAAADIANRSVLAREVAAGLGEAFADLEYLARFGPDGSEKPPCDQ